MKTLRTVVVVVVVALVSASCSLIGGGSTYRLTAYFSRTISLFESSQVRVLGLPAGKVVNIAIEGDRVRVDLDIDDSIPLPADVHATVVPLSLIGERYVQLFPAWTEGQERVGDGAVIPLERTSVPVEPDEALAALKKFLDTLDPDGTGRLITNLDAAFDGNGTTLNSALHHLSGLVQTFADKDDVVASLIARFDEFTGTVVTRERQLGQVLDAFAGVADILAAERSSIEGLVGGLASTSNDALDLVTEHGDDLREDLAILGRTLRAVDANLDSVDDLLDSGPILVTGLAAAYNPEFHRTDLRNSYGPTPAQALINLGVPIGGVVCLPVDVACTSTIPPAAASSASTTAGAGAVDRVAASGASTATAVSGATVTPPRAVTGPGPLDALFDLLTSSNSEPVAGTPSRPWWHSLLGSMLGLSS